MPPKRCSAADIPARRSCWWASSRATRRIAWANRSWGPRGGCSPGPSKTPASIRRRRMRPTRSSTSSSPARAASDGSTRSRAAPRWSPAGPGSSPRSRRYGRRSSSASARRPRNPFWERPSGCPPNAAGGCRCPPRSSTSSPSRSWWRPSTRRRVARSQRTARRVLPALRRRPAQRACRSRGYPLTPSALARTCAKCTGLRPAARWSSASSRIWVRQLNPSASTSASGSARRSAGISLSSAQATDTS